MILHELIQGRLLRWYRLCTAQFHIDYSLNGVPCSMEYSAV